MTRAALCALAGTLLSCPVRAEPPEVLVDLTHTLDEHFPFIPVEGITYPFSLSPIATLARDHVAANEWHIHEHLGTQIDAPNHFIAGGRSLEMLRPDELLAPLVVIDACAEATHDPDFALGVADILRWERTHGRIPEHALVALDSGWSLKVADADAYLGRRADQTLHFPGFSAEAVVFLAEQRNVWGVGVDTISLDPGQDRGYAAHRALLARDKLAIEALAQLEHVPPRGAHVFIGAPKVRGATGGPVRVLARFPSRLESRATQRARALRGALQGTWTSAAREPRGARWLVRTFSFRGDRWALAFQLFDSADAREPVTRGAYRGTFELTPGTQADGALLADFLFDAPAPCGHEFDRVQVADGQLRLGARPSVGDLCDPARRATSLGPPLLRVRRR